MKQNTTKGKGILKVFPFFLFHLKNKITYISEDTPSHTYIVPMMVYATKPKCLMLANNSTINKIIPCILCFFIFVHTHTHTHTYIYILMHFTHDEQESEWDFSFRASILFVKRSCCRDSNYACFSFIFLSIFS